MNVKGKTKSFRQKPGKRADWKKAYVRIQADQMIDFGTKAE
jgi:large subunit ribosomal protein L23